jgi:ribosomal protein S2
LRIPVISFLNTSDDPTLVDYPVLGNFNSKDAGSLYYKLIKRFLK